MKFQTILPPPSIAGYVSSIAIIENYGQKNNFTLPLFANGSPTLVFNSARSTDKNKTAGHLDLYGQTIQPNELTIRSDFMLIAYFFDPQALRSLFGLKSSELTDTNLELRFFKQARALHLEEQLLNTNNLNFRLSLINNFIKKLGENGTTMNSKINFAEKAIKQNKGQLSLQTIQQELGVTERSLQRLFETNVGVSPRLYSRICQFHAAFQQFNGRRFLKYSDVAFENGFSDQSHFIRVFKEFTDLTPTAYLKKISSLSLDL